MQAALLLSVAAYNCLAHSGLMPSRIGRTHAESTMVDLGGREQPKGNKQNNEYIFIFFQLF